ncbi:MAG: hypothetical protein H7320_24545 [Ferruginibacter sp.]|nr:hypothetical protein [Ferruginibacter sp.]
MPTFIILLLLLILMLVITLTAPSPSVLPLQDAGKKAVPDNMGSYGVGNLLINAVYTTMFY